MSAPLGLPGATELTEDERHQILHGRHILVVDDDELARRALRRLLEIEGCQVTALASLAETQAALDRGERGFDAAVIDYWLVGETGSGLVRLLRSIPDPCCALLITGTRSPEIGREAIAAGAGDFLLKPFTAPDFLAALVRTVASTVAWRERLALTRYLVNEGPPKRQTLSAVADRQRSRDPDPVVRLLSGLDLSYCVETVAETAGLSAHNKEILRRFLLGEDTTQIAADLGISPRTVKYHASLIYKRLGVHSRNELLGVIFERFGNRKG